mgnify:CR=1 FL=1
MSERHRTNPEHISGPLARIMNRLAWQMEMQNVATTKARRHTSAPAKQYGAIPTPGRVFKPSIRM